MRVFVSWSGAETLPVAEAVQQWVRDVVGVPAWVSSRDIGRGTRWFAELSAALEDTEFAIACVTRANVDAPWLSFEVGAAAKRVDGRVAPLLLDDLDIGDVRAPLAQFQAVRRDYQEMYDLLRCVRDACGSDTRDDDLRRRHDKSWPDLLDAFDAFAAYRHVGPVVENGTIRATVEDGEMVVTSLAPRSLYYLRWVLPNDRGDWDIPPTDLTVDGRAGAYPVGTLRPGQTVRVPARRTVRPEVPLHIRYEWHEDSQDGPLRQMECWIEA